MNEVEITLGEGKRARRLKVAVGRDGFVVGIGNADGPAWDEVGDLVKHGWLVPAGVHKGERVYRLAKVPPRPEARAGGG